MSEKDLPVVIIGYSGHAYVVIDALQLSGRRVTAYCDQEMKTNNPFDLAYLGKEREATAQLSASDYFASVGDNTIRKKICDFVGAAVNRPAITVIHPGATIASSATVDHGVLVAAGAVINALAVVRTGTICNTGSIIEHECRIGEYVHIAPGAVLCGNVTVGDNTFIGASSVIRQGITIGTGVVIGAGSVVTRDVPDGAQIFGNPAR
ncbi:acetyltransferase [Terrimonas sp. NA20]|uniref:Acetyltransferase n=1 Tax=Terrimonas ginsenosidimutans TaxID=2908004 RepID=A0ABS9KNS5_9BACT|nr:acetyltransferase [Terrimonas ginsenosidimutans]MCG2613987.1 acetyltransferase [Terrimonas ginsenosidimutans]